MSSPARNGGGDPEGLSSLLTELAEMRHQLTERKKPSKKRPRQMAERNPGAGAATMASVDPAAPQILGRGYRDAASAQRAQALLKEMPKQLASKCGLRPRRNRLPSRRRNSCRSWPKCGTAQQDTGSVGPDASANPRYRTQLAAAIHEAASSVSVAPPVVVHQESGSGEHDAPRKVKILERERNELESELDLVRRGPASCKRPFSSSGASWKNNARKLATRWMLRELAAQSPHATQPMPAHPERELVGATAPGGGMAAPADPVVSSVMAQFARLQKDVAQRRKKR